MAITIEHLHKDIIEIKNELTLIRNLLYEDFELTDEAKEALDKARKTPKKQYIQHEELKKKLLK